MAEEHRVGLELGEALCGLSVQHRVLGEYGGRLAEPASAGPDRRVVDDVADYEDLVVCSPEREVSWRMSGRRKHGESGHDVSFAEFTGEGHAGTPQDDLLQVVDEVARLPRTSVAGAERLEVASSAANLTTEPLRHGAACSLGRRMNVGEDVGGQPPPSQAGEQLSAAKASGAVKQHALYEVRVRVGCSLLDQSDPLCDFFHVADTSSDFIYYAYVDTQRMPELGIGPALVTGATGKVGTAIVRALLAAGVEVRAMVRDARQARLPSGAQPVVGDLRCGSGLTGPFEGCDLVFNAAGLPEQWLARSAVFFEANTRGARLVAEVAARAGVRRLVQTSTIDVFDAAPGGTFDEGHLSTMARPGSYQRSKQEGERAVLGMSDAMEIVVVNSAAVLGLPARAQSVERSLIAPALAGGLPVLPPGGLNLVGADSLAHAQLRAAALGQPGERYIVSDGFLSVRELVRMSLVSAGRHKVPPTLPPLAATAIARLAEPVARLRGRPPIITRGQLANLLWRARADSSRAQHELGWRPNALSDTIAALVAGLMAPASQGQVQ